MDKDKLDLWYRKVKSNAALAKKLGSDRVDQWFFATKRSLFSKKEKSVDEFFKSDEHPGVKRGWVKKVLNAKLGFVVILVGFVLTQLGIIPTVDKSNDVKQEQPSPMYLSDSKKSLELQGDYATYLDGSKVLADGIVVVVIDKLMANSIQGLIVPEYNITDADYPVVMWGNPSGFDATGDVVVIRRLADGKEIYRDKNAIPRVRYVMPREDGQFLVQYWDGKSESVTEDKWLRSFYRSPNGFVLPEGWEKMSEEELRKLGFDKLPRSAIAPKTEPKVEPKVEPKTEPKRARVSDLNKKD